MVVILRARGVSILTTSKIAAVDSRFRGNDGKEKDSQALNFSKIQRRCQISERGLVSSLQRLITQFQTVELIKPEALGDEAQN